MLFLARSALCIGIVATMLPEAGHRKPPDDTAGRARVASRQVHSAPGQGSAGQRRLSDQPQRINIERLAGALANPQELTAEGIKLVRATGVSSGVRAMLKLAAHD